jgi:hypothetical protein
MIVDPAQHVVTFCIAPESAASTRHAFRRLFFWRNDSRA